jgi:NADPH-dependent 2,4-dienoyl-CoA reductase/sulfur reductase-like enzyme
MPYHLADPEVVPREKLVARTPEQFRGERIEARPGHRAIAVDPEHKNRLVRDRDGKDRYQPFDDLLFATGAAPIMPPIRVVAEAAKKSIASASRNRQGGVTPDLVAHGNHMTPSISGTIPPFISAR